MANTTTTTKFAQCPSCYFFKREPAMCFGCKNASEYEPEDADEQGLEYLRELSDSQDYGV